MTALEYSPYYHADRPATNSLACIIATTPRTGGHLFSDLLSSTQVCGRPSEYVLPHADYIWRCFEGCTNRREYLNYYLRHGWSANNVFGAKVTWRQFCAFTEDLTGRPSLNHRLRAQVIEQCFGRCLYIFLRRRDRIRQAISYFRAMQTGQWSSKTASTMDAVEANRFDANAVDKLLGEIDRFESIWLEYFNELPGNCLQLYYEDLARNACTFIAQTLAFLGINEWSGICRTELKRQSDGLTEEWVRRYKLERGLVRVP
jgi:LPS sulfotransferase NodH